MSLRVDVVEGGRIAARSLGANRLRTALTMGAVGIGVATLIAIVAVIQGLNAAVKDQLATIGATTLQVSRFSWGLNTDWWRERNRKMLGIELLGPILSQSHHIRSAAPVVWRGANVFHGDDSVTSISVLGTTHQYVDVYDYEVAKGRFLSELDDDGGVRVVVLGAEVAKGLFPNGDELGQTVAIRQVHFRVIGTLSPRGKIFGENQDLIAYIPFKIHRALFGRFREVRLAVAANSPEEMDQAEDELVGIVRRARGTPPDEPDDFAVNRPEVLMSMYKKITGALYGVAVAIGLITLLVGGIGIMNIMLVSVRERTREIGVRRALGARRRTIVWQFLLEAATVSAVGGALGTGLGIGLAELLSLTTPLAAAAEPLTIVFGILFAGMVGLLFGIWPAVRASRLDPIEALRYE